MSINYAQIKDDMATAIADALAAKQGEALSDLAMPAFPLSATFTWNGTATVATPDTSEVTAGDAGPPVVPPDYIQLVSDGKWYKILSVVTDTSVTVEDTFSVGSFPSGATQSAKSAQEIPAPPTSSGLKDALGIPIADAVVDGIKTALDDAEISGTTAGSDTIGPGVIS